MVWNISEYEASASGNRPQHGPIQAAIDACHAAGGGRVLVPAGRYVCGPLRLKSGVELHLAHGAVLATLQEPELYPRSERFRAMILAEDAEDVAITGTGTVDGQAVGPVPKGTPHERRIKTICFDRCRRVRIADVSLMNSDCWTLHLRCCRDVRLTGLTIENDLKHGNADGIDPDSCQDVIIRDCRIRTGDDCIVLKACQGEPCENIIISGCLLQTYHGPIKLGTESVGDIRNVLVSDCVIRDSVFGVSMYVKDGGSFEDIRFSNLLIETMIDRPERPQWPIYLDLGRRTRDSKLGRLRRVSFEGLHIRSSGGCLATGLPERPIEGLSLRGLRYEMVGPPPEHGPNKPMGSMDFDRSIRPEPYHLLPACLGFAHVQGLELSDLELDGRYAEGRGDWHAASLRQVRAARVRDVNAMGGLAATIDADAASEVRRAPEALAKAHGEAG